MRVFAEEGRGMNGSETGVWGKEMGIWGYDCWLKGGEKCRKEDY